MEDTCKFEKCVIAKRLKIKRPEECVNHVESWWTEDGPEGKGKPVKIDDCAPVRTMLMVQELHGRLVGVEKSQEQQRNALQPLSGLIQMAKDYRQKALA